MQLYHIKHKHKGQILNYLGLYIKTENGMLKYLDSKYISPEDVALIKSNVQILERLSPEDSAKWLRENVPVSFQRAYRTVKEENCEVIKKIGVGALMPPSTPSAGAAHKTS